MPDSRDSLLILRGADVRELLRSRHREIIDAVKGAYIEHAAGASFLPHSVFVRFPGREKERIIALPGYLGGDDEIAGIKWIASFPGNLQAGLSRASAVIVLNSLETGRPHTLLEGSTISAMRTAASAALAAEEIHAGSFGVVGFIGCGLINRQILGFVLSLDRGVQKILVHDIDDARARAFAAAIPPLAGRVAVDVVSSTRQVLEQSDVVSFATTAVKPTVPDLAGVRPAATILHVSLRDLQPAAILSADNVVDDVDHVLRADTSVDLARREAGHARFIRCTIADIAAKRSPPRRDAATPVVFSPFGLGVLDLAVARLAVGYAREQGIGRRVDDFFAGT